MSTGTGKNSAVSWETVRAAEVQHTTLQGLRTIRTTGDGAEAAVSSGEIHGGGPIGLALSGGGIRSATFSLGVLQALATRKRLQSIDILSTVSGGGYIGGWLSAWIHRDGLPSVENALGQHALSGHAEPRQIVWLRRYSNYLTPRVGALSLDALTVAATWLRNVLLNLIILISFFSAIFLLPVALLDRLAVVLINAPDTSAAIALVCSLAALSIISRNLTTRAPPERGVWKWAMSPLGIGVTVILPGYLACFAGAFWFFTHPFDASNWLAAAKFSLGAVALVVGVVWWLGLRKNGVAVRASDALVYAFATLVAFAAGVGLMALAWHQLPTIERSGVDNPNLVRVELLTWGPPTLLLCFGLCVCIWIGLVGRRYYEPSREWWSRTGGGFIMASVLVFAWAALAFYVPYWVELSILNFGAWSGTVKAVLSSTWLATLLGAIKLAGQTGQPKVSRASALPTWLGMVLASLVVAGLVVAIAYALHGTLDALSRFRQGPVDDLLHAASADSSYWLRLNAWHKDYLDIELLGALAVVALVFAIRVDINRFSLHNMYKNRIIRCYLGASNGQRNPQPFTGFDESDDVKLTALVDPLTKKPQKPLHIINTAMNLVQGSELAWQQRKAASFVFTPAYCGFAMAKVQGDQSLAQNYERLPGFQPTATYASKDPSREEEGFTIGMAVATSGAAVSPSMGVNTQPALAAVLTLFDVRLGRWSPNPAGNQPQTSSPRFGLGWLLAELLGFTNERRDFVYLSDGGHFENMGIYELVRRRCRRILAVDAGADPNRTFADLGNMVRKCRVDLDTEIDLPLKDFYAADNGRALCGHIHGRILYPVIGGEPPLIGEILVIKPSLCNPPKEPADIFNYASATAFPQESTVDQWFDESQFESYRSLGYRLASAALDAHPAFFPGGGPV